MQAFFEKISKKILLPRKSPILRLFFSIILAGNTKGQAYVPGIKGSPVLLLFSRIYIGKIQLNTKYILI